MELTNKQKIKLVNAVGLENLFRHLPQRACVDALGLRTFADIERRLGCTRSWITHGMKTGQIPEPTQKLIRRWYFTEKEVAQIEDVWKNQSSK